MPRIFDNIAHEMLGALRETLQVSQCVDFCVGLRPPRVLNYIPHQITNGVAEKLNAKIQWIKYQRGFQIRERLKLAIYFHCGGLDINP